MIKKYIIIGNMRLNCLYHEDNLWVDKDNLSAFLGVSVSQLNNYLKDVFCKDLKEEASILRYGDLELYNIQVIVYLGYRINSKQAIKFRKLITSPITEFILKGFALNDDRLKQVKQYSNDYFDELIEKLREIRCSNRNFYQKITDAYAVCSIDYDNDDEKTLSFYLNIKDKLINAATGKTPSEIILERSDCKQKNMGLVRWLDAPNGKILESDVSIARNYLTADEYDRLTRITSLCLDSCELQTIKKSEMTMSQFIQKFDEFLLFYSNNTSLATGNYNLIDAQKKAISEYQKYRILQDIGFVSDYDVITKFD